MENRKVALITGITGQDGSYLAELLLSKGYDVHGTIRRSSTDYRERIAHLEGTPNFHLHYADLGDSMSIIQVMNKVKPTEVYNLAAQSHVQVSFDSPEFTADVDATGVLRILEAIRQCGLEKTCRMYQASTSELYGKVEEVILHTLLPSSMVSGLSRSTARHIICSAVLVSSSITRVSAVVRHSLLVRLHWLRHASSRVSRASSISVTWIHFATGVMPKIM